MAEVLKYQLYLTLMQKLTLSKGAQLLDVQPQGGALSLWAACKSRIIASDDSEAVTIYMIGTGHEVPKDAVRYITTLQLENQTDQNVLVVHIYEGPRE